MSDEQKITKALADAIGSSTLELLQNSRDPNEMLALIKARLSSKEMSR